ncbi:unnamed protein product, partial [marine sediment metagenome]
VKDWVSFKLPDRLDYDALGDKMKSQIHALSLKTKTMHAIGENE